MAHCDTRPATGSVAGRAHSVVSVTLRLVWNRAGAGEPLLLVHGIGTTHADFAALRPGLDAAYDVLAPDLPGHADSPPLLASIRRRTTSGGRRVNEESAS
jgi:pimeloyl-ACP methyl ester carboxylesterase